MSGSDTGRLGNPDAMSSFIFADCPPSVPLTESKDGVDRISVGSLTLTVRNVASRSKVGILTIQPEDMARSGWFWIAGAPASSPAQIDIDCDANATQSVKVDLRVPEAASPGRKVFTLRIAAEDDPDNDYGESPAVAFEVRATPPKPEPKAGFPWWIVAAVAGVVILGGLVAWFAMRPGNPCENGLVLRDIFPGDFVCVKPEVRKQVEADNAAAASRIQPNDSRGSNYCRPGYVWRDARPGDDVCVTPEMRTRTAEENKSAPKANSR